jgi:hypothetical protein
VWQRGRETGKKMKAVNHLEHDGKGNVIAAEGKARQKKFPEERIYDD